jgi:hypothetical protein
MPGFTPCSPLKINQRFEGTHRLHLQGCTVRQARNQLEPGSKQNTWLVNWLWMMKNDVKGRDFVSCFKPILQSLLQELWKTKKVIIQDSQHQSCESKPGPHENKALLHLDSEFLNFMCMEVQFRFLSNVKYWLVFPDHFVYEVWPVVTLTSYYLVTSTNLSNNYR